MKKKTPLKTCPFCGHEPEVQTLGSCIDIDCCASMSIQKCDVFTLEERDTWNGTTYQYSDKAEHKAWERAAKLWNKRA